MPCTEKKNNKQPQEGRELHGFSGRRQLLGLMSGAAAWLAGCATRAPVIAPPPEPAVPAPEAAAPAPVPVPAPAPLPAPEPAPAPLEPPPAAPVAKAAPRKPPDLGPAVKLPPAASVRNWDEFRKMAARRMVASSPKGTYMSKPPPLLFGIPVLEIELNADGTLHDIVVTRQPANIDAQDTIEYAIAALERAAPYGDISRLPKPWKWTEVFLFNNKRQFKPRSLD